MKYIHHSDYFYGNKISNYGLENGYVDYATLAKSFDCILNNDIIRKTADIGYWEEYNGSEYDEENDEYIDVYQCYIISKHGAQILSECTKEIVWYNEELDMYIWGVTHYGTTWSYVLTDIKIEKEEA